MRKNAFVKSFSIKQKEIAIEELEKEDKYIMAEKKKLSQKERLEADVVKFDQQIESMRNQLMQLIGAKTYAQAMLKQMKESKVKEK